MAMGYRELNKRKAAVETAEASQLEAAMVSDQ